MKKLLIINYSFIFVLIAFLSGCDSPETQKNTSLHKVDGKLHGENKWFYEDGTLQLQANYNMGVLDGVFIRYHENGKKELEEHFENGLREGSSNTYYPNGNIKTEAIFKQDTLQGIYYIYHRYTKSLLSEWKIISNDSLREQSDAWNSYRI